jgi:hypothetical protein
VNPESTTASTSSSVPPGPRTCKGRSARDAHSPRRGSSVLPHPVRRRLAHPPEPDLARRSSVAQPRDRGVVVIVELVVAVPMSTATNLPSSSCRSAGRTWQSKTSAPIRAISSASRRGSMAGIDAPDSSGIPIQFAARGAPRVWRNSSYMEFCATQ